jgi:probable addiction module antidote protein
MPRAKTLQKQSVSSKNTSTRKLKEGLKFKPYNPTKALLDEDRIGRAIWECLKNEDPEGVIEIIGIHLEARNKAQLIEEANIPKTTLYHSLRSKNPTLKTLAKIVHACAA